MIKRLPNLRKLLILSLVVFIPALLFVLSETGTAVECKTSTECAEKESQIREDLDNVSKSLDSLSKQLSSASYDYYSILGEIDELEGDLTGVESALAAKKEELDGQVDTRNFLIRELYKQKRVPPLDVVLSDNSLQGSLKNLSYFQGSIDQIESKITVLNAQVDSYEEDKAEFEELKEKLLSQRNSLSAEIGKINYLISYYNNQKTVLGSDLNAAMQKQALLAWQEKQAGNGKQSLGGAGSYTFYGYGTEHGVGMSQYGAKKLSDDQGKSGAEIIQFYYPGVSISTWSSNNRLIKTSCAGTLDFEDEYLAGIGEVPNSWPAGVKEAQIIAARSYAWGDTYTTGGSAPRTIPCDATYQVYVGGTGKLAAVNATRGRVATYGGSIARLFYHSTSGPHTDNIWDSPSFNTSQSSYPYLKRVNFNDTNSPYNNWCGLAATWNPGNPPPLSCTGSNVGAPLTNADLEFILNASMLKYKSQGGHLEDVGFNTTPAQVESWLNQEGTTPIKGLKSVAIVRVGGSSDRVKWFTAIGSNRTISDGVITGKRFRYIYNILSPQADFLWSTWFYVK